MCNVVEDLGWFEVEVEILSAKALLVAYVTRLLLVVSSFLYRKI